MTTHAEQHRLAWERRNRRRLFLKTLGLGAAGVALGGGAAWAQGQAADNATQRAALTDLNAQYSTLSATQQTLAADYATLNIRATALDGQVTALSAQNTQLTAALSTAQQETAALTAQLADAQSQLIATQTALDQHKTLVALYEQLEALGLDEIVIGGLSVVANVLSLILNPANAARAALTPARDLLTDFESTLDDWARAMAWLGEKVVNLKVGLWFVEDAARQVVSGALTGVDAVFGGFAGFVLDRLPFNIGANVRATLTATQTLLTNLVSITDEADNEVMLKISRKVQKDQATSWHATLLQPLRENTLASVEGLLDTLDQAASALTTDFDTPTRTVIEQRRVVRESIATYRAAHNL
jgi:cell division protein FtsB